MNVRSYAVGAASQTQNVASKWLLKFSPRPAQPLAKTSPRTHVQTTREREVVGYFLRTR